MLYAVIALGIANLLALAALAWYFRRKDTAVNHRLTSVFNVLARLEGLTGEVQELLGLAKGEAKRRRQAGEAALREASEELNDDEQQGYSENHHVPEWARGALPPKNPVRFGVEPEQEFLARHKTSDEG